ncbi:guanine deaminase [Dermacoccaceae bacterium W4C1]
MTILVATVLDTPDDPFAGGQVRALTGALLVRDGVIEARGLAAELTAAHPDEDVVTLAEGVLIPGLVDTHVHLPQTRMVGGLGMPLLEWLERRALPEEARLADRTYAAGVATDFLRGLARAGTTSALVFGSHFSGAVDELFTQASESGLRITAGLVLADRILRAELLSDPERSYAESVQLARRWHGQGRLQYAVTPRFSLSSSAEQLSAARAVVDDVPGVFITSHINENPAEIEQVCASFEGAAHYLDTYDRFGLLGERTVLAHDVHPRPEELARMAQTGTVVSHCPTSNAALGSGLFPMAAHQQAGVRMALGSDVCAGTGFSLFKEGLQAYFVQQYLGERGLPLGAAHLMWLATRAGALALGQQDVGDLSVGRAFDAVWVRPRPGSELQVNLAHAQDDADAVARIFALAGPADVAQVWVGGDVVHRDQQPDPSA